MVVDKSNVWTWGFNYHGQLGDNSISNRLTPVSIYGNHNFCKIFADANFSLGLDNNGQSWTWGYNNYSMLGNGDASQIDKSTPVAVCGNHTFCKISQGMQYGNTHAIDNNNIVWGWGRNDSGALGIGDGTRVNRITPVRVYSSYIP